MPQEQSEHDLALHGGDWMSVCLELDVWLRNMAKHEGRQTITIQEVRDRIHGEMESSGLGFD